MVSDNDLFIAYGVLMSAACVPIYFGSYNSLSTPATTQELVKQAKAKSKKKGSSDSDSEWDSDEDDNGTVAERLTSSDAWLFPVMGSVVLFGLFLVFKYLNKEYVNMLLSFYFAAVGCLAVTKLLALVSRGLVSRQCWKKLPAFKIQLSQRGEGEVFHFRFTHVDMGLLVVSLLLVGTYVFTKHWVLSNVLALSLALNAIALMSLDSFRTGAIMLGGLFLYDIFWVFGTPVMVSVARNFDAPIKIVWPKNTLDALIALRSGQPLPDLQFTMLGLGDIVVPGVFVALALRFDQIRASESKPSIQFTRHFTRFPKPYFIATMIAYVVGLATTMVVMHVFKAAQPALLYLSPACVGSVFLTALARGEFSHVWNWTDADEQDEEENDKSSKGKQQENNHDSDSNANGAVTSQTSTSSKAKKRSSKSKK